MIPPKQLILSESNALVNAESIVSPIATPHGLVCLITTAAGSSGNSFTVDTAASKSIRLL